MDFETLWDTVISTLNDEVNGFPTSGKPEVKAKQIVRQFDKDGNPKLTLNPNEIGVYAMVAAPPKGVGVNEAGNAFKNFMSIQFFITSRGDVKEKGDAAISNVMIYHELYKILKKFNMTLKIEHDNQDYVCYHADASIARGFYSIICSYEID